MPTSKRASTKAGVEIASNPAAAPINRASIGIVNADRPKRPDFNRKIALKSLRGWAYAALMLNAQAVASVPLRLYAKKRTGSSTKLYKTRDLDWRRRDWLSGDGWDHPSLGVVTKSQELGDEMVEVTEPHPITNLLNEVNPYLGGFSLTTLTALWWDALGDAYWVPMQGPFGVPDQIVPLLPHLTEVIPGTTELVAGYRYGRPSDQIKFSNEEVINFQRSNPSDVLYGMGRMQAAWDAIQQNEAAHEMDYAMFGNLARPDYAVVLEEASDPEEIKRFEQHVEARLRGTKNSGRFMTVTGKVQFQPLNWAPKDVGSAGREKIIEEIAGVCGTPVAMLLSNDPNRANADTAITKTWAVGTILPCCRAIEDVLNHRLVPLFDGADDGLMLAFDDPVPSNRAEDRAQMQAEVQYGLITANEARKKYLGADPVATPEADMLLYNGQPLGQSVSIPSIQVPGVSGADGQQQTTRDTAQPSQDGVTPSNPIDAAVQDTALNGAQVTALLELVRAAQAGEVPVDAAREMALAAYPSVPQDRIQRMFAELEPREFVDPSQAPASPPPQPPAKSASERSISPESLTKIARMVDQHNAKSDHKVTLEEAVSVYLESEA